MKNHVDMGVREIPREEVTRILAKLPTMNFGEVAKVTGEYIAWVTKSKQTFIEDKYVEMLRRGTNLNPENLLKDVVVYLAHSHFISSGKSLSQLWYNDETLSQVREVLRRMNEIGEYVDREILTEPEIVVVTGIEKDLEPPPLPVAVPSKPTTTVGVIMERIKHRIGPPIEDVSLRVSKEHEAVFERMIETKSAFAMPAVHNDSIILGELTNKKEGVSIMNIILHDEVTSSVSLLPDQFDSGATMHTIIDKAYSYATSKTGENQAEYHRLFNRLNSRMTEVANDVLKYPLRTDLSIDCWYSDRYDLLEMLKPEHEAYVTSAMMRFYTNASEGYISKIHDHELSDMTGLIEFNPILNLPMAPDNMGLSVVGDDEVFLLSSQYYGALIKQIEATKKIPNFINTGVYLDIITPVNSYRVYQSPSSHGNMTPTSLVRRIT